MPILVMLFAVDMRVAVGTSLAYMVPVAFAGALQHGLKGNIKMDIAVVAALFGIIGAFLGVQAHSQLSSVWLKRIFGILMLLIGLKLLLLPRGLTGPLAKCGAIGDDGSSPAVMEPVESNVEDSS